MRGGIKKSILTKGGAYLGSKNFSIKMVYLKTNTVRVTQKGRLIVFPVTVGGSRRRCSFKKKKLSHSCHPL